MKQWVSTPRGKQEAVSSLNLSGQQRSLLLAFERLDPKLARMYLGALRVLADEANPDAMPLAAHALREIMEKLPESLDVPLKASAGALSNRVAGLLPIWQKAVNRSSCHSNGEWQGQLDGPLERLLKRLEIFFDWYSANYQTRRGEIAQALRRLDASGGFLPTPLESANLSLWRDLRDFFLTVAHHKHEPTRNEFASRLQEFESFLVDRLQPKTFADFDAIDALLEEVERR